MCKGLLCHIFSMYKQYFGQNRGTMLQEKNRKLSFNGTDSVPSTKFVKTNSGKTCTFYMIQNGTRYYLSETNDNNISLKPGSSGTAFRVKSTSDCSPIVSIQSTKSDRYIVTDKDGRVKMQDIKDTSETVSAWFMIEEASGMDEVDGKQTQGYDKNNNDSQCIQEDTRCYLTETSDNNILLKEDSPGTAFKFQSLYDHCISPIVPSQLDESGRHLTIDEEERLKTKNMEDASETLRAWLEADAPDNMTEEVDKHQAQGLVLLKSMDDHNNNNKDSQCMVPTKRKANNKAVVSWNLFLLNICSYMYNMLHCLFRSKPC